MTETVPLKAKTFEYVPDCLKDIEGAPVFTLRYGTRRDKHSYKAEIAGRGLVSYSDTEIREAMIDEIKRLSGNSDEAKARMIDCAQRYWAANTSLGLEIDLWRKDCLALRSDDPEAELPPPPELDFDPEERAWIIDTFQTVQSSSAVIRTMNKANVRRDFIANEVALSIVLIGAQGFVIERDIEGLVTNLPEIEEWLGERAEELGIESVNSGDAYAQLLQTAFLAFHLPKEMEKNFASLLPATSDLNGSHPAAAGDVSTSQKSEKSKEIPSTTVDTTTGETSSISPSVAEAGLAESPGQTAEA